MRHANWWLAVLIAFAMGVPATGHSQDGNGSASFRADGRSPFQQSIENGTCEEAPACQVTFKVVPARTRLVITHFNAVASTTSIAAHAFVYSTLSGASGGVVNTFLHIVPTQGISFANDETLMYFEAGTTPVAVVTDQAGLLNIRITISGYLINLP